MFAILFLVVFIVLLTVLAFSVQAGLVLGYTATTVALDRWAGPDAPGGPVVGRRIERVNYSYLTRCRRAGGTVDGSPLGCLVKVENGTWRVHHDLAGGAAEHEIPGRRAPPPVEDTDVAVRVRDSLQDGVRCVTDIAPDMDIDAGRPEADQQVADGGVRSRGRPVAADRRGRRPRHGRTAPSGN